MGFTDKCGVERNRLLPAITIGSNIRVRSSAETKARDWFSARYCVGSGAADVTHGSSGAGNKNAARREKGDTMEMQWAQRVDDCRETREGEELPRSLRRCYNWRRSAAVTISFALSRMNEQKAHSTRAVDPSYLSLHFFFHLRPSPLSSPPARLHHSVAALGFTFFPTNGLKSEISRRSLRDSLQLQIPPAI